MHESAPFQVTPEARNQIIPLLRPPPGMEAALLLSFGFESRGAQGITAKFEGEYFMIGFYSFGQVAQWPRIELCGHDVSISPEALERLRGRTLAVRAQDVSTDPAHRKIRELLVVA